MATLTGLTTFSPGTSARASEVNANFLTIKSFVEAISTGSNIDAAAITSAKLATSAVTTDKIANSAVTTDKIATGAVVTVDIADNNVTLGKLESAVSQSLAPTGSILVFAGPITQSVASGILTTTAPAGWALCDGSAISTTQYAALFAAISSNYNTSGGQSAPGAGLFRLPILTGRVPVGRDSTQTEFDVLGETGGAKTHTLTTSEIPSHDHDIHRAGTLIAMNGTSVVYNIQANSGTSMGRTNSTGSGGAHNNLQPYISVNYIIKL